MVGIEHWMLASVPLSPNEISGSKWSMNYLKHPLSKRQMIFISIITYHFKSHWLQNALKLFLYEMQIHDSYIKLKAGQIIKGVLWRSRWRIMDNQE